MRSLGRWMAAALAVLVAPTLSARPVRAGAPPDVPARIVEDWCEQDGRTGPADAPYLASCHARRVRRLGPHLDRLRRVIFTRHFDMGGSHYAYTEGQSDAQRERHFRPGSSLCLLEMDGPYGTVRTLLDDRDGVIRDPEVSWDGRRVLFAWKKSDRDDDYHLYEVALEGTDDDEGISAGPVRQITDGLGFADYEGQYLPSGDIVFNSTRCVQTVDCWWTEVSNLYTCDPRGRYLRRLSFDQVHTNFPTVTPDGRVVYTRWDYNDRGQIYPQGLFQMYPDGTGQTEVYGNNSYYPTTILHARAVPGTGTYVATFTGHHTRQQGWLGLIDPGRGRQEDRGAQLIAPVRATPALRVDRLGQQGDQFQYPWPLGGDAFLVTLKPAGSRRPFAIYFVTAAGERELLAWDESISSNQPIPLAPRPRPPLRPDFVDYTRETGTVTMQDVYAGPGLAGVERGTIKRLRVVALRFRAAGVGNNHNRGPAGSALVSTPISIGGAWDVKVVLGTARVYEDGSACFEVGARTPVYFQALDGKGHAAQTMRSWLTVQPGETVSCVGCHENKNRAPPVGAVALAQRAGPEKLEPWQGPPRGFSFHREIQPILDRHCVGCHHLDRPPPYLKLKRKPRQTTGDRAGAEAEETNATAAFSLQGEPGTWSRSYRALAHPAVASWISPQSAPPMLPPYHAGAAKSKLVRMLESGHGGVPLSAEDLDRVATWIDLLVPCFGDYREGLAGDGLARYDHFLAKRRRWEAREEANIRAYLEGRWRRAGAAMAP